MTYMVSLSLQEFDKEAFLECIKDLIRLDKDWVPKADNCSLYIRPAFIGTEVGMWVWSGVWLCTRTVGMACCPF